MNRTSIIILSAVSAGAVVAAGSHLNVRTGGWEMTTVITTVGSMIPSAALSKMPPEQRQRLEANMKAMNGKPRVHSFKSCVTEAELNANKLQLADDEDDDNCKTTVLSASPVEIRLQTVCAGEEGSSNLMTLTAVSPTQLKAVGERKTDSGSAHIESSGTWKSASCKGFDD